MKNKPQTLKEFNQLYSLQVVSMKNALVKDNLMELDYKEEQAAKNYQLISNETKEVVFEFETDTDEKFIRALMEKYKIKELELYYMCD